MTEEREVSKVTTRYWCWTMECAQFTVEMKILVLAMQHIHKYHKQNHYHQYKLPHQLT